MITFNPVKSQVAKRTFKSLSVRNYRLYFIGQVISMSGTWMQTFAQGWLVLNLTHDNAIALGFVAAAQFSPVLIFGPWGGLIADRHDKRTLLFFTQGISALLALVLGLATAFHMDSVALVICLASLLGCVNVIDNPTRQSFVMDMVGKEVLSNAISLNSVLMNLARVVGPGMGGIIIGTVGLQTCFFFNAGSFAAVILALALMNPKDLFRKPPIERAPHQLRDGFSYVRSNPNLLIPLIVMTVVGLLAYNFQVTLLLLGRETFHQSAAGSGSFFAVMGAGAVVGGLMVASRRRTTKSAFVISAGVFGALLTTLAFAPNLLLAEFVILPMGAASIAYIAISNSTLQLQAQAEYRGRVMSLFAVAFLGTTPIGSLLISVVASQFGPRSAVALGGIATMISALIAALVLRKPREVKSDLARNLDLPNMG
ncbi:MAG: MFS transporter [Acidimicrobiales bacterium]|nr:MFS transporter [Acidimicrobiales bacterium]